MPSTLKVQIYKSCVEAYADVENIEIEKDPESTL